VKLNPNDVAVGPDGSVFIADQLTHSIYRILPGAGTLCRVAGTGSAGAYVDGDSATKTQLRNPQRLALGPDGSIYFVMKYMGGNCTRACRVTPDGIIHSIAGTGEWSVSSSGDGGPATQAKLVEPSSIALGIDGSVFIGDGGGHRVRRVDPDGIITTYAGTGGAGYSDSTGPAIAIRIGTSEGLAVDGDGSLYIAEASGQQIRRVTPDGVMSIFLKGAPTDFWPWDIDFGPDGALYIVSGAGQHRIYKRDPDGNLLSIAGTSGTGSTLDGSYAARTAFYELRGIGVGSDGTAFFTNNAKVIGRLAPALASKVGSEFVVPSADGSEVFYFDEAGKHVRTRDALTGAVRYVFNYDAEGRLISLYDVNGDSTVIARGENGQAERIVAPYGQETALGIDAHGYLHTVTNPASQTITVSARPDGLLESLEDAKHQVHEFEYHPDGRLWVDSDPAGGSQTLTKDTGLNRHFVTRETALHRSTSYELVEFSDGARQRLIKGPDQLTVVLSDSTDGNRRGVLPTGVVVTHSLVKDQRFGVLAPLLASEWIAMPSGLTRTVQVSRTTDPSGFDPPFVNGTWTEERSVNGRASLVSTFNSAVSPPLLSVTTPEERVATATVDSAGRPLTVSVPGQADVTLTYDARGRLERSEQRGRGLRFGYDARGRLSEVRDTLGRMTSFTYDSANRVIQQDLPGGRQVVYGYDDNGNLTSLTPPGRPTHRFDYTPIDLMAKYYSPGAGEADSMTEYVYNADRQLERILRPGDDDVLVNYNTTTGRVESIETGRGEVGVTYLTTGQVHTVTSPDGVTLTYAYDGPLDTLEAWSGGVTGSVSAAFDRDFRVSSQRVNGGDAVVYDYDNDGLMTQAGALAIDRERNDGLISGTTLQNVTTTESYWHVGELWRTTATIGGYTLYQATYERDSLGRITEITETVLDDPATTKTYTYGSPDTGFIATVATDGTVSERYSYDGNGNRLRFTTPGGTTTAEYDDQDRITRYGTMYYTYAPAGELATASTGGNLTRYTYDALGNLVKVRFQNGDSLEYVIDGRSRRVARKFNGTVTRKWLYQDQLEPVAELDGAGTLVARYVYGTRPHVPDYMVRNDTTYRIISDHLGSVRLVVNASTGDVAQYIGYDTYGRLKFDTNPGFQCFGYAGGLWDSTTGLVRFGARDYDPSVGRWTAKDPIGFAGLQTNLYAYVQNQPSQLIDPFGLDASQRGGASSAYNYMVAGEQMLGHLAEAYGFAEGTRRALAQRFPGTGGASVLRHELASELIAYYYGGSAVRILGVGNEVQGLLLYDVPDLLGRLRGLRPWAFEVLDLVHNEIGIKRAERARLRLETRGHDSPCQGRSD
jgi:RHS repeat-associated protein